MVFFVVRFGLVIGISAVMSGVQRTLAPSNSITHGTGDSQL
jgi:hypothetical protein